MTLQTQAQDWTPRTYTKDGIKRYCAPWCGGDCKRRDYDHAQGAAERLCEALGPGFVPVVHENLGWHYRAERGMLVVYEHQPGMAYLARLNTPVMQFSVKTNKAHRIVELMADSVNEHIGALNEALAGIGVRKP